MEPGEAGAAPDRTRFQPAAAGPVGAERRGTEGWAAGGNVPNEVEKACHCLNVRFTEHLLSPYIIFFI